VSGSYCSEPGIYAGAKAQGPLVFSFFLMLKAVIAQVAHKENETATGFCAY
jgi:hypothetical protein